MSTVTIISHPDYQLHLTGSEHPESPKRINATLDGLVNAGLLVRNECLEPSPVDEKLLLLCHTDEYVQLVKNEVATLQDLGVQNACAPLSTGDAMICSNSFYCALLAIGGVLLGVDSVFSAERPNRAFCVIRPPGHHASKQQGMGFCLFNNVGIAARYAQKNYGLKRVAIIDWDVHHGNGTQRLFEEDSSVLYASIHESPLYPFTGETQATNSERLINCPITKGSDAPERVLHALTHFILPALDTFKPQLLFISCGFDAHRLDPLGNLGLTDKEYSLMTEHLVNCAETHCDGRIVSALEGGYSLEALASASAAHIEALGAKR